MTHPEDVSIYPCEKYPKKNVVRLSQPHAAPHGGFMHGHCPKVWGFERPSIMIGNQLAPCHAHTHACVRGFQSPTP